MKPQAVGYIRMSSDQQEDSPAIQKSNIIAKFGNLYEIVAWYQDLGKSGSKDKDRRSDFLKMLKDSTKSKWKVILCNNPARFTREDSLEAAADKKTLRDNDITVISVIDGLMDWTTSTGRIVDAVKTESQNDYVIQLAKNTLDGKIKKAKEGKTYGQTTPYGMARLITDSVGNTFEIARTTKYTKPKDSKAIFIRGCEDEAKVVEWIFAEYLKRDVSFHQLAKELNEKKIKSPLGGTWVYQVIHEMLKNPRYVGDLSLGTDGGGRFWRIGADGIPVSQNRKSPMQTGRAAAIIVKNTHKGIIDRKTFDLVQVKLARKKKTRQHSPREEGFALTGVVFCGCCGKPMYGCERKDAKRHRVGIRYSCKGWHRSFEAGCGQWMVHQDDILPVLIDVLKKEIDDTILAKVEAKRPAKEVGESNRLAKQFAKLKTEYDAALKRFLKLPEGHPSEADLDQAIRSQKAELNRLEKELAQPAETDKAWFLRCHEYWQGIKGQLIAIEDAHFQPTAAVGKGFEGGFGRHPKTRQIAPSSIRELFHSIGLKVTLWFDRAKLADGSEGRRWIVVKAHIATDSGINAEFQPTENETLASVGLSLSVGIDRWLCRADFERLNGPRISPKRA